MASRRRRWPLVLLIVVLVLAGLVVAADRIAVVAAERIAGDSIESSQHLSSRPDVAIHGFPFLTQFASATYDDVDVTAHDVPLDAGSERTLTIDTIAVHLAHVTTSDSTDFDTVAARSATADARVAFTDLERMLGVGTIGPAGGNRIQAAMSVSAAGQTVRGTVSAAVTADGNAVRFADVRIAAAGTSIPGGAVDLGGPFRLPIPLDGLPFRVVLAGVSVGSDAITLHLAGRDLRYENG